MVIKKTAAQLQKDAGELKKNKLKEDEADKEAKVKEAKIYGAQGTWYLHHRRKLYTDRF